MADSPARDGVLRTPPESPPDAVALEPRPNGDVLDELRDVVDRDRPRYRLHVRPDDAMWIAMSVGNTNLDGHVSVVPDPEVPSGHGWYETITPERWRQLQALVGRRVAVTHETVGRLVGTLARLEENEAVVDLDETDRRYVRWITLEAVS